MKTYVATDITGNTVTISAYTESDARQQANDLLGLGQVVSCVKYDKNIFSAQMITRFLLSGSLYWVAGLFMRF